MNFPSVKTIRNRLGVDDTVAKQIRGLLDGSINPEDNEGVKAWRKQCYTWGNSFDHNIEKVLCAIDHLLGGFGTEVIQNEKLWDSFWTDSDIIYVNMGDTYNVTVMYFPAENRFRIGCWGDFVK